MDEVISNDVSALSYRDRGVVWRRRGMAAVKHRTMFQRCGIKYAARFKLVTLTCPHIGDSYQTGGAGTSTHLMY